MSTNNESATNEALPSGKIPSTPSPPKESEKQPVQSENVYYAQVVEKDYAWKEEQEQILKKWADKALCFKMMHEKSHKRYWCLNAWFNIPIIIISTITGTGNFASGNFIVGSSYFIFALGALNLFGGILATIATYTGVAQKLEAHRFASIGWDKFARRIQIELAKSRKDRVKARDFIRQSAEEYDRLIEMSPILPNDIIRWFINLVKNNSDETMNECATCCHETFCFACGCGFCLSCCCPKPKEKKGPIDLSSEWNEIDVPEIIGRIKSTKIADIQIAANSITSSNKIIAIKQPNDNTSEKLFRSQSISDLNKKQTVTFANSIGSQSYRNSITKQEFLNKSEPILEPKLEPTKSEPILELTKSEPILEPTKSEPKLKEINKNDLPDARYYYPKYYYPEENADPRVYRQPYIHRPREYNIHNLDQYYIDKQLPVDPSSTRVNPPLKNYNLEEPNLTPRTITSVASSIPPSPRLLNQLRLNKLNELPTGSIKSADYPIRNKMSTLNESPSIKSTDYLDNRPTLIQRDSHSSYRSKNPLRSESPKSTISSISSPNNKNNNSFDSITKLTKEVDELLSSNNDKSQSYQNSFEKECVRNISQLNSPLRINNNEIEMTNLKSNFEQPTQINLHRYHSNSTIHISDTENDLDDDHSQYTDYTI